MAEEKEGGAEEAEAAAAPKKPLDKKLLFLIGNAVVTMAALGTLVYTKLLFKRPPITEEAELQKKVENAHSIDAPKARPIVTFDQLMVNIAMTSGKAHYATVAWAVECRDEEVQRMVEDRKDLFMDRVISTLGKRQITELNTIQGKLLLKTELLSKFNELTKPAGITDIYFNTFILQ